MYDSGEVENAESELFPMMVILAANCIELTEFRPFEQMLAEGLVQYRRDAPHTIFVSHQWLSRSHPDPDGVQLRTLNHFLKHAMEHRIKDLLCERDWLALVKGIDKETTSDAPRRMLAKSMGRQGSERSEDAIVRELFPGFWDCFLWVDYMSVPQEVSLGDDSKVRAIYSIPFYIKQSSLFFILCPKAENKETREICDYWSWQRRGWCRLEEWANNLSSHQCVTLVLTEIGAKPVDLWSWYSFRGYTRAASVGCGNFACCTWGHKQADGTPIPCDKDFLLKVLKRIHLAKCADQGKQGFLFEQFMSLETHLFVHSLDEPRRATWGSHDDDLTPVQIMKSIDEDRIAEKIKSPTMVVAAMLGDERVIQACVERGDDPLAFSPHKINSITWTCLTGSLTSLQYLLSLPHMTLEHVDAPMEGKGYRSIHSAAAAGHSLCVAALLQYRANAAPCTKNWRTPLHNAASHGHTVVSRMLLGASAPVDAQDQKGLTPLHLAASGFSLWCSQVERAEAIRYLLESRANPAILSKAGLTPGDVAVQDQFQMAVDLLQQDVKRRSA